MCWIVLSWILGSAAACFDFLWHIAAVATLSLDFFFVLSLIFSTQFNILYWY